MAQSEKENLCILVIILFGHFLKLIHTKMRRKTLNAANEVINKYVYVPYGKQLGQMVYLVEFS